MRSPILYDFIRPKEKLFKGDSAADLRLKEERTITTRRYFKLREEAGRGGGGKGNGGHDMFRELLRFF